MHDPKVVHTNPNGKYLVFLYENYKKKSREMNTMFNALSLMKNDGMDDISFLKTSSLVNHELVEELNAYDFPSIYLIARDQDMVYQYEGDSDVNTLKNFVHQMIKIKIQEVKSLEHFNSIKKKGSNILMVGDVNKFKTPFNIIAKYSKKYFKSAFWTINPYFYEKYNIKSNEMDAVAFFTQNRTLNDGERMNFSPDELNKEQVLRISEVYSRKPFSMLTHYKFELQLQHKLKTVFLMLKDYDEEKPEQSEETKKLLDIFKELSLKYREEYWFLKVKVGEPIAGVLLEALNLDDATDMPAIGLVDNVKSNNMDLDCFNFNNSTEKTLETVEQFLQNHKAGKLHRIITSEFEETEEDKIRIEAERLEHSKYNVTNDNYNKTRVSHHIKDVVGFNFQKNIFNNPGKDVVLFICSDSDFCNICKTRYKRAVKKLLKTETLYFSQINPIMNELPGFDFTDVPALIIVPDILENKDKKVFRFSEKFTSTKVFDFIKDHTIHPVVEEKIENEEKYAKSEDKKDFKYKPKAKDEQDLDVENEHPVGNGFTKAVQRYFHDFEDTHETDRDQGHAQQYMSPHDPDNDDHDNEEYDFDEERGYFKKGKSDL